MRSANSILEDISTSIGFTATLRLAALKAGTTLIVPTVYEPGQTHAAIIGEPAWRRMIADWPGERFDIPHLAEYDNLRLLPGLASRIQSGASTRDIARAVGLSDQHIRRLRVQAEEFGLLDRVFHRVPDLS